MIAALRRLRLRRLTIPATRGLKPTPELVVVQGIDHDITGDAIGHRPFQVASARVLDVLATGLPDARIRASAVFTAVLVAAVAAGSVAALAQATVPGKNGPIVYRQFKSLIVVNADGTGERKLTHPPKGWVDDQPDWSPDGLRIAFQRCTDDCQVWTVAASGTGLRRLGSAGDDRAEPAWAPGGKQIAYTRRWGRRERDQFERAEIYVMNTRGGAVRRVTGVTAANPSSADVANPAWSPNGKRLVFAVQNSRRAEPANGRALFVINADGSGLRQLTPWSLEAGGGRLDWSPDGRLILFRIAGAKPQQGNIYTVRPDGSGLKQLTRYPPLKAVELGSFSPDGKWITFSRFSGRSPYASIFAMRTDGTGVHRVTKSDANYSPDWGGVPADAESTMPGRAAPDQQHNRPGGRT